MKLFKAMLICSLIGFLMWIGFINYLCKLWVSDKDDFWITLSIAGILFLVSSFWMILTAQVNKCDFEGSDNEKR